MIRKLYKILEETEITPLTWLGSFVSILFLRYFLESISSPPPVGGILVNTLTSLHFSLFFIAALVSTLIILLLVVPEHRKLSIRFMLFGVLMVLLAPILDLIITQGEGEQLTYLIDGNFFGAFFTFLGTNIHNGATLGLRIELVLILIVLAGYVYHLTRSWKKAILTPVLVYSVVFILGALPALIASASYGHAASPEEFTHFFFFAADQSVLHHTISEPMYVFRSVHGYYGMLFNSIMAQLLLIISLAVGYLSFKIISPKIVTSVFKNIRIERTAYYLTLLILGVAISHHLGTSIEWNWVDVLSLVTLSISVTAAWISSVFFNDITDFKIDEVTNVDRPLPKGELTKEAMYQVGWIFTIISLVAAASLGTFMFYFMLLYQIIQYVYSFPPLRLRRFYPINSMLVALAGLIVILTGFFLTTPATSIREFPLSWMIGIFIFIFCFANNRDIKDLEGDKREGVQTLPTLLGNMQSRYIIAGITAVVIALVFPLLLMDPRLLITTIPIALFAFHYIATKKHSMIGALLSFFILMAVLVPYLFLS